MSLLTQIWLYIFQFCFIWKCKVGSWISELNQLVYIVFVRINRNPFTVCLPTSLKCSTGLSPVAHLGTWSLYYRLFWPVKWMLFGKKKKQVFDYSIDYLVYCWKLWWKYESTDRSEFTSMSSESASPVLLVNTDRESDTSAAARICCLREKITSPVSPLKSSHTCFHWSPRIKSQDVNNLFKPVASK